MGVREPQSVHDVDTGVGCATVVHVIGNIVEVEEPVHEVAANTKLGVARVRVAHGGKQTSLETMERVALPLWEVAAAEEPLLALDRSLLAVAVVAERECAVGDEVRDEDLGRSRSSDGVLRLHG